MQDLRASTVADVLRRSAARTPGRVALRVAESGGHDREWTYAELDAAVTRAAGHLLDIGAAKGDRIAVYGKNSDAYLIGFLACARAGLVHVPVNDSLTGSDLSYVLAQSGSTVVLVDPALYETGSDDAHPIGLLGSEADGGFAQYVVVAATRVHTMTGSPLSDEQLACLPIAYGTAMGMLERARIAAGESVLVTGASGGVGLALVQLAAARGARVTAVTTRDKSEFVSRAGAHALVHRDAHNTPEAIARAAPEGLDAVTDVAGGDLVSQLLPRLHEGGRWVIAGAVAGPVISFDLRRLYLHNLALIGSSMHTPTHFGRLAETARHGHITPRVAARYQLTDIHAAQHEFAQHAHAGKITITP